MRPGEADLGFQKGLSDWGAQNLDRFQPILEGGRPLLAGPPDSVRRRVGRPLSKGGAWPRLSEPPLQGKKWLQRGIPGSVEEVAQGSLAPRKAFLTPKTVERGKQRFSLP